MGTTTSQITSLTIVYSTVYSGSDQRKHQSSTSQAFVRGIHQWPVNSPHKGPVTRTMFPFDDIIIYELLILEEAIKLWHNRLRNANQCLVKPLQWCFNGCDGISNHQPHDCLLNCLFRLRSKKTSKLLVISLCDGSPVNSLHKGPVTRTMFPFDDVIIYELLILEEAIKLWHPRLRNAN